ncbi:MAG: glycosyltransferase [Caulobacteraceae bacterium]
MKPPAFLAFTCLIPVWARDDPAWFAQALESLVAGQVRPDEILVCEDGPLTAELEAIAADFAAARGARRIVNPGPRGLAANLNHAMAHVATPWAARADADDLNLPGRFAAQVAFLEARPGIDALGAAIVEFFPDGRERVKALPTGHEAIVAFAAWRNPINHMTAFFRTEAFRACGGYPPIPLKEDYGLWLAMIAAGFRLANLAEPVVRARLGASFHARRAGLGNIASEYALFERKRRMAAIGPAKAGAAFVARAAALGLGVGARLAYERVLRRRTAGRG